MVEQRDTIPRLHRVVEHSRDQLVGIADGHDTFEDARLRYGATQERLAREGRGRVTASRVAETEKNWAPSREVLSELIRLKALEAQKLPSARKFLDAHRDNRYHLTDYGLALADVARAGETAFIDQLTEGLIRAHPYLRRLLLALGDGPIVCPNLSEGDVERGRQEHGGTAGWGEWAADQIGEGISPEEAAGILTAHLRRRFGAKPPERPSNRAISEAMNDGLAVAGLHARGLELDASTIKTLLRWGTDLLLYDQSRYVGRFPETNTIWLACDVTESDEGLITQRRGVAAHGADVAAALVDAYWKQATSTSTLLTSPYISIHRVRADAACETQTMRRLADLVLGRMADGAFPELGVAVDLHIGTSHLPNSEPPFRHHGRRRLEMTLSKTNPSKRSAT